MKKILKNVCMKMKPLVTNQRVLTWLNVCPVEETATKREKNLYFTFNVFILIIALGMMIGSVLFLIKYWSIDLEAALLAFFQISVMFGFLYMTLTAYVLRQKITAIFTNLTDIFNESNCSLFTKNISFN